MKKKEKKKLAQKQEENRQKLKRNEQTPTSCRQAREIKSRASK